VSLVCSGQSFTVYVDVKIEGICTIPNINIYTKDPSIDGTKAAFLKSMEQFANSEHFAKIVYELENGFCIHVIHTAHLDMPG
jgi:hypothetical protein